MVLVLQVPQKVHRPPSLENSGSEIMDLSGSKIQFFWVFLKR